MSCDLTDPAIIEAYNEITSGSPTNWLILGYHDTRDKVSLYSKGTGGLPELTASLTEEVLYGFVRIDDRYVLLTYVSEQVSGLRRARALVHGKAVGALFKASNAQLNTTSHAELTEDKVRARLGLTESPPTPETASPAMPSTPERTESPTPAPRPITPMSPPRSGPSTPRTERQLEIEAAERKVREETERQKLAEVVKRQRETEEREARERDLLAQKQALEEERKRKDEADKVARETMKKQLIEMERLRGLGLSGYITIQGAGSPFWKRRFYVMRGQVLAFFRDENDRAPVSQMNLGGQVVHIEDASLEVLIPNSFRVDLKSGDTHYFFSDTIKDKEMAIAGFMKCNESA
ncbi:hypothetical protein B0O80DRAFT_426560 [Mortierella sp. GBAus27b]|nr:hypothetical protein BGX31_002370 [Mortierella sp. GBA43]KAI8353697.1 hypothetical protein B0O80DRAFT_426560 [Mortierella sp. GBAus27b]